MPQIQSGHASVAAWVESSLPRWTAVVVIVLVVIFADVPGGTRYGTVLQNSAHGPAFALLFLLIAHWIRRHRNQSQPPETLPIPAPALSRVATMAFAITVVLGLATETIQWVLGRDAEMDDVFHDALGAGGAATLWLYWQLSRVHTVSPAARYRFLLAGVVCVGIWSLPLLACGIAYWGRAVSFPVIGQFSRQRDLYFTEIRGSPAVLVPASTSASAVRPAALEITLQGDPWPGVTLVEPKPDWSGYRALVVAVSTAGSRPIRVNVRVDDEPAWDAENNFTGGFTCAPNIVCVHSFALDTLVSPQRRQLDVRRISRVIVFHGGPLAGEHLRIHRVWLAR